MAGGLCGGMMEAGVYIALLYRHIFHLLGFSFLDSMKTLSLHAQWCSRLRMCCGEKMGTTKKQALIALRFYMPLHPISPILNHF